MAAGGRAPDTASLEGRAWQVLLLLLISTGVVVRAEQSDSDLLKQSVIQRKLQLRYADQVAKYIERWSGYKQLDAIQPTRGEKSSSGQALRLVSGSGPWEGMVEVYDEGRWKRLKANRWSERETRVVCRQLGYISLFSKFPSTLRSRDRFARKASLAMEIDKCSGGESSVMQCSRARVTADTEVGVSCYTADDLSSRCADSEIPYADRCYYFGRERVTRLKAGIRCQQRGATLVHVTSQAKNDFLSGVMLARGMSGLHTSGYGEALDGSTRLWFWRNSTKQFLYNNWSPVTASVGGDTDSFQPRCLTLRMSNLEDGSKYALWESSLCSDRLDFVCESKRSWRECMSGNGALYAGNISTSESDRVCLPWASVSQYPGLTSPTLKDNYCRNPDNDQRPWCFTSSDSFEYCDIPICPPFLPQPERKSRVLCDNDSFRCSENDCVPASYVCDGDQDCGNNRDEIICQALPYSYQVFPNNDLRVQGDFEGLSRYTGRTLRNCQYVCLVDPDCRLFVYFEDESMCITTSTRLGEAWPTRMSGHTVYAVLSRYQPCLGHRCDNFQCLNTTTAGLSFSAVARARAGSLRCDGTTDCDDLSDEKHCSDDYGFALRLSDGDGPGSGRLEARIRGRWGAVCDDLFDIDAAFVACRQLGFRRPLQFYVNGRGFASSSSSKSVQYTVNGVLCLGNETSLAECTLLQKPGLCVPGETVSLHCTDQPSLCSAAVNSYQCLDGSGCVTQPFMCSKQNSCDDGSDESEDVCENAQFRLEPGSEPRYLTVKPPGRFFRNITAYNFDSVAANYVCSRLAAGRYGVAYRGDDVADSQQMAVLSCTTASSSDTSCDVTAENQLLPRTAVRLFCGQLAPPPVQVRLKKGAEVGGTEGVVELMPPLGQWGLLCSLSFTQQQAEVICRQLGFRGRASYQVQPRNPDSRVSALAMDCFGDESDISQCLHTAWMNHTGPKACNGSEQVYVTCGLPPPSEPANLQVTPLCSDRKADLSRILGGSVGEISDNAWFAHVDVRQAGERRLKCGASMVSARFVLTAAHCLFGTAIGAATTPAGGHLQLSRQPFPAEQLSVVVGDSGSAVIDPGQRQVGVRRVFRHPAHRALNIYHNDIALLQLAEPLVFTENVRPACLPPPTLPYSAELTCRVVGLGKLAPGLFGQLPGRLQTGAVSFFTRSQCVSFYGRANITAGMVCAGDDRFRVDTCDGDSGGPLTCRVAGVNVVMGITSWGHGCGRSDFPGVYTKVTHYLDWIHHVVAHN